MLIIFLSLALASPVNGSTNIESIEELSPNEYERETDNKDTDLIEGDVLTKENLRIVRPGLGLAPKYYDVLLGRKVNHNVKKGTSVDWALVE